MFLNGGEKIMSNKYYVMTPERTEGWLDGLGNVISSVWDASDGNIAKAGGLLTSMLFQTLTSTLDGDFSTREKFELTGIATGSLVFAVTAGPAVAAAIATAPTVVALSTFVFVGFAAGYAAGSVGKIVGGLVYDAGSFLADTLASRPPSINFQPLSPIFASGKHDGKPLAAGDIVRITMGAGMPNGLDRDYPIDMIQGGYRPEGYTYLPGQGYRPNAASPDDARRQIWNKDSDGFAPRGGSANGDSPSEGIPAALRPGGAQSSGKPLTSGRTEGTTGRAGDATLAAASGNLRSRNPLAGLRVAHKTSRTKHCAANDNMLETRHAV
jgi:hypothetical protein